MKRLMTRKSRHARIRAKISGTENFPRLSVFRSNRHLVVQLIDDVNGRTIVFADDLSRKNEKAVGKLKRSERAQKIGELLAERAKAHKITGVVFDRGGYKYHGIVRAVAEGARKGGLKF